MALTVGELNGLITIDDRAVDPALRRAENALRASGQQMGDDAERSGQQAGQQLGDGIVRGTDGRLRNAAGRFVAAGRQAGDAVGDGLGAGAAAGADDAVVQTESRLSKLKVAAAAVGLAAGAVMMDAFGQALEQSQITGRLGAQLGATPAEAQRYGKLAGELYADAVTADFQGAADAISAVMRAGIAPPDATNAQLKTIATRVSDLAGTFELDLGQTANAVGQMLKTGLAKNGGEALDVLTKGLQQMGPRADDIADTFNEYSTIFRSMGLDGKTATGLLSQGLKAGARDTDTVADAIKEFSIEAVAGSSKIGKAWEALGLDSDKLFKQVGQGGDAAKEALDQTLQGLATMEPGVERNALAVELFGTKAEDLGESLYALDPAGAAESLGKVGGAASKMGDSLRDNAGAKVEQFKRGLQQGLVNAMGTHVIPVLLKIPQVAAQVGQAFVSMAQFVDRNKATFITVAAIITTVMLPTLVRLATQAVTTAATTVASWATQSAAAVAGAARFVVANTLVVAGWVRQAAVAVASGARVVATWVLMGVQSMIQAGRMAAAWLIAMGPIGWVIAGIVGLVALVVANWDTVKKYTLAAWNWVVQKLVWAKDMMISAFMNFTLIGLIIKHWSTIRARTTAAWNAVVGWVKGIPGKLYQAFLNWTLLGLIIKHWSAIKTATVRKALEMVAWVRGLPGRISGALGSLGSLLVSKGKAVVQGLWSGIKSMGGWIKSKLISWAKDAIPGPIAKALGIASPSKVTKAQGRWIARGLVEGLTGSQKQVRAAAYKLVDIVRDSLAPGKRRSNAFKVINRDAGWLDWLAVREEKVAKRLKDAQKKLQDQIAARDKLAADVKKGVLDSADITQGTGPMTADGILARLQRGQKAADLFAKNLAALSKKGVRKDLIAQIAQAGVDGGAATAAALASANTAQVKQINAQQALLTNAAAKAGNIAGDAMYGSGIRAAQGLVKGLQSQQKTLERTMLKLAQHMSKAIRKALGIKSPSRVMAQIGKNIPAGLRKGIESGRRAVDRSMAGLVATPTQGQLALSAAGGTASGPSRVNTTNNTYNLTTREITLQQFEALQRRQDALARVGRPR
ncbi:phage tail tape measure protein [Streptomyces sp. CA-288835]|uniref:phage tail tape measure protein n=1 Tax=Streptomyces sp. CA-288835 TaxID=3240069 RepID=UPI003D94DFB2